MFYSKFMFVKKGPLAKVWIAAHFHRKLNKSHVQGTDINLSVKSILDPATPLALRLSGQLLLGLVRIYQRKVKYLQEDCSEALTKMKMIFRPGAVDLPPEASKALPAQITYPDDYDKAEFAIPDIPLDNLDDMMGLSGLASHSLDHAAFTLQEDELALPPDMDLLAEQFANESDFSDPERVRDALKDLDLSRKSREAIEDLDMTDPEQVRGVLQNLEESDSEKIRDALRKIAGAEIEYLGKSKSTDKSVDKPVRKRGPDDRSQDFGPLETTTDDGGGADSTAVPSTPGAPGTPLPPGTPGPSGTPAPLPPSPGDEVVFVVPKAKKRRPVEDQKTEVPSADIANQLRDTSDIVARRLVAPLSKRSKLHHLLGKPAGLDLLLSRPLFTEAGIDVSLAPELLAAFQKRQELSEIEVDEEERAREREARKRGREVEKEGEKEQEKEKEQEPDREGGGGGGLEEEPPVDVEPPFFPDQTGDTTLPGPSITDIDTTGSFSPPKEIKEHHDLVDALFAEGQEEPDKEVQYGWSVRSKKMHDLLVREFRKTPTVSFETLIQERPRKTVAGVFYQLLVLKSHGNILVDQSAPYSDILISRDPSH